MWNVKAESRKCVIPVVCVKLGKLCVVKHNCVAWGVFNDYIMDNYMFRPVLAIFRLSYGNLRSFQVSKQKLYQ